jgi:hypothetical protein
MQIATPTATTLILGSLGSWGRDIFNIVDIGP